MVRKYILYIYIQQYGLKCEGIFFIQSSLQDWLPVVVICDRAIDSKNKGEVFQMLKHHHHKDVWNVAVEFYAMLNLGTRWR